jgi:hypothetical protein
VPYDTPTPRGIRKPLKSELAQLERLLGENADDTDDAISALWTAGAGVPNNANGVDGDWYLDTTNIAIYQKAAGAWALKASVSGTYLTQALGLAKANITSAEVDADQSTASTSFTDLATVGPAVTATTGTRALLLWMAAVRNSAAPSRALVGVAISGATTTAASDLGAAHALIGTASAEQTIVGARVVTGLTAGSNTFTLKYRTTSGALNVQYRRLIVIPL